MNGCDVAVEYQPDGHIFHPESERGRRWLQEYGAPGGWSWRDFALVIGNEKTAHRAIIAAHEAGLEVGMFPRDSRKKHRTTDDGDTIH